MLSVVPGVELLVVLLVYEIGIDQEDCAALLRHVLALSSSMCADTLADMIAAPSRGILTPLTGVSVRSTWSVKSVSTRSEMRLPPAAGHWLPGWRMSQC